jgi:acyl-CoA thioesterase
MTTYGRDPVQNITRLKHGQAAEPIAAFLGMTLVELTPGYAKVRMQIGPEHLNFNGFVFGGTIISLADHAFAYGSNSLCLPSVATQFNTHFLAAPAAADELIAECHVIKNGQRLGLCEITVTNGRGILIAKATGMTVPL